ncbi:hypothetical protein [Clostridium sp.]|uniref:hypothetical protein n=1 Tax=Clostridium sp. TaxID=1506 RepID=UPI003D6DA2D0
MNLEDRNIEDIDMQEEYEMIPFEPMMYGYEQMNMNPNMGMNSNMGMNPNMEMNQGMGMCPCMGLNPWMGMSQFNEGLPTNGFNPMGMMYGDATMNDLEDEDSRQLDKYQDKDSYKGGYNNPNKFNPKYNDVDSIVRRIERYNPAIFRLLTRCGMSYVEAREIVRRIVRLTLMYSEE